MRGELPELPAAIADRTTRSARIVMRMLLELEGALERLRPILSTTLTTCLGLLPLAIGLGGRDDVLAPMAVSISAGLGFATGLVLLVVPAIYLVVEDVSALGRRIFGRGQRAHEPAAVTEPPPSEHERQTGD